MPTPPRILFLVTQDTLGGAQQYVLLLARAFRDRANVGIATAPPVDGTGWLSTAAAKQGITSISTIPHLRRAINPYHDIRAIMALRVLMQSGAWDIVHANSTKAGVLAGIAAWSLGKRRVTRVVYTAHGWVFLEPLRLLPRYLYLFLEWLSAHGRDATIVLSHKEETVARDTLHVRPETITVIAHTLSTTDRAPMHARTDARAMLGIPEDTVPTIGVVANMYRTKGLDILLRACDSTPLRDAAWRLVIIGDGPERHALEAQRARLQTKNTVHFVGALPDAASILSAFDLFVLPSRKEGLPFALLEALAAGLPIIATDVGGVREMLESTGDIIVPPNDPAALAAALTAVLARPHALQERQTAAQARAAAQQTTQNDMYQKTWAVYERLLTTPHQI